MNTTTEAYVPGVCNINTAEIAQRRKAGYLGVAIFVVLLAVMLVLGISRWARLLLIVPALLAAIGFLQAKNRFCVGYGGAGMQNATEGSTAASRVSDDAAAKDKARSRQINLQALAIGVVVGLLTLLIPVF